MFCFIKLLPKPQLVLIVKYKHTDKPSVMTGNGENFSQPPLKRFKKVPVYVVEEHNDALQFVYSAIGGKKLPLEGTTLLHFDAHPDMLIDRKLKGIEARSGRELLPLLQIENWIVPAAAAGHIERVVWLRPPWAKQFTDGSRVIQVGDHPETGLLRINSKEPYYMSDGLYSRKLDNERTFKLTVAEVADPHDKDDETNMQKLAKELAISHPYVLDIDLDFFSTGNPFLSLYENIQLYDRLEPIFGFKLPDSDDNDTVEEFVELRERQLNELENLFQHLEEHNNLENYEGEKTTTFHKVSDIAAAVSSEATRLGEPPNWWGVYAGGCTRDQGGLPHHISTEEEVRHKMDRVIRPLLKALPTPVLVTVARSTDDGYCPPDQVDYIQSLVLHMLKEIYDTNEPEYYYLNNSEKL